MSSTILVRTVGRVREIVLAHPGTRNSLTVEDFQHLAEAFGSADGHEWVLLRSGLPGSFCSGFRLNDAGRAAIASGEAPRAHAALMLAVAGCRVPVVGLIDGPAVGMGCELALRCDLRFGSSQASFAVPAARHGLVYPAESVAAMVAAIGRGPVAALLMAGQRIDAERAVSWGLVQDLLTASSGSVDMVRQVHRLLDDLDPTSVLASARVLRDGVLP